MIYIPQFSCSASKLFCASIGRYCASEAQIINICFELAFYRVDRFLQLEQSVFLIVLLDLLTVVLENINYFYQQRFKEFIPSC